MLELPLRCSDPAIAVMDATLLDVEAVHHPVAREPVVPVPWDKLWVRANAIEGSVEIGGHLPMDHEVECVGFRAKRGEIA